MTLIYCLSGSFAAAILFSILHNFIVFIVKKIPFTILLRVLDLPRFSKYGHILYDNDKNMLMFSWAAEVKCFVNMATISLLHHLTICEPTEDLSLL